MEKFQGRGNGGHRFKRQPDQAGDEVGELEGGFPFAQIVGGEDLPGFDSDLTEAGDEEFPADDEGGDPDGADALGGQKYEGGADQILSARGSSSLPRG